MPVVETHHCRSRSNDLICCCVASQEFETLFLHMNTVASEQPLYAYLFVKATLRRFASGAADDAFTCIPLDTQAWKGIVEPLGLRGAVDWESAYCTRSGCV